MIIAFSESPLTAEQQMSAIIYYMTAFGFVDGSFDVSEQAVVRHWIRVLVEMRVATMGIAEPRERLVVIDKQVAYFDRVFVRIHAEIQALFDEAVAEGETAESYVLARLRLRCFELFKSFDRSSQQTLLLMIDKLVEADGVVHAAEQRFRDELVTLLTAAEPPPAVSSAMGPRPMLVTPAERMVGSMADHPILQYVEHHYSRDPQLLREQMTRDHTLMRQAVALWDEQRARGAGRLAGRRHVSELNEAFLDGFVYVLPDGPNDSELVVLGDLHGCYTCLKAALMQSDFFRKVSAYRQDPQRNPEIRLVLLGDYVDRGKYSYDGIVRTILQLFTTMPEHVVVLRGNHEYYVDMGDRVSAGVAPAEAIATFAPYMPKVMFDGFRALFDRMPSMLIAGRTLFVHAGIPRDATVAARWRDLSTLNDPDLRFEMMWSDPANANHIPSELQKNARFPFGKQQFRAFMERLGCNVLVRGHEKIDEGYKKVYDEPDLMLINLFSAGGAHNEDLPANSSYRAVTPMALTIRRRAGVTTATPWPIEYQTYVNPALNGFMRSVAEIEFRG